jgi:hypothetical protein
MPKGPIREDICIKTPQLLLRMDWSPFRNYYYYTKVGGGIQSKNKKTGLQMLRPFRIIDMMIKRGIFNETNPFNFDNFNDGSLPCFFLR